MIYNRELKSKKFNHEFVLKIFEKLKKLKKYINEISRRHPLVIFYESQSEVLNSIRILCKYFQMNLSKAI